MRPPALVPSVDVHAARRERPRKPMLIPKHLKLDLRVMELLCAKGMMSTREAMESFPESSRPAYFSVRSTIARLQSIKAVRHVKTVAGAQIFEATVSVQTLRNALVDEFADLFIGDVSAAVARLVYTGRLSRDDLEQVQVLVAHARASPV
jgi:predicted transcriptional regulator